MKTEKNKQLLKIIKDGKLSVGTTLFYQDIKGMITENGIYYKGNIFESPSDWIASTKSYTKVYIKALKMNIWSLVKVGSKEGKKLGEYLVIQV